jgi:hypothetical protein
MMKRLVIDSHSGPELWEFFAGQRIVVEDSNKFYLKERFLESFCDEFCSVAIIRSSAAVAQRAHRASAIRSDGPTLGIFIKSTNQRRTMKQILLSSQVHR